ncbi:hypothetical protein ALC62_11102, partial [Cyphomyrmex costatus]
YRYTSFSNVAKCRLRFHLSPLSDIIRLECIHRAALHGSIFVIQHRYSDLCVFASVAEIMAVFYEWNVDGKGKGHEGREAFSGGNARALCILRFIVRHSSSNLPA